MDRADWERAAAIYLPLAAAVIGAVLSGRRPRQFPAILLSILWTLPALLILQRCNQIFGWWSFSPGAAASLRGMPLELFLGWALLWGVVPHSLLPRLGIARSAAGMILLDVILMPALSASIQLQASWLWGELAALLLVLLPALCVGHWTQRNTHLAWRAAIQVATSALVFFYLLPEIVFALRPGKGWSPLLELPGLTRQIDIQVLLLVALPGVAAVQEFVDRGGGTPIPYDPPQRLVASGIYRFCANPMQLSCTVTLVAWAALLRNGWMLVCAFISLVYSAGLAEWDEQHDLAVRFGQDWKTYRLAVRSWRPRWRPHHSGAPAQVYLASTCAPCRRLRRWIEAASPIGLEVVEAETLPADSIQRMRYDPPDGTPPVEGVLALGRVLEHLHLGWALVGAAMRLPGLWRIIQMFVDAAGLGRRTLPAKICDPQAIFTDVPNAACPE